VTSDGSCLVDTSCMATPTRDLSSQGSRRKQMACVWVIISAIVLAIAGCGSSTGTTASSTVATTATSSTASSGAASFIGQATNAEIFIQWTRAGNSLSGSLQEAVRKEPGSSEVESSSRAFTGTVDGDGLTLTLNEGLGTTKALVGQMTADGFTMTFPAVGHELTSITFVPGQVSDYNHAVSEIEGRSEQGPSSSGRESTTSTSTTGGFAVQVHNCGTLKGPGSEFTITTDNGVSCSEARNVFIDLFAGKGERHQGADAAESHTDVDGWGCGSGAGGFGCSRSGAYIGARAE